ncbi:ABC-2 family transporter protein [Caldanaerobius fijiensis DSM 17918]|uniref:ABC-2 family transporter protein n=1 Tax=Caldanaerobius fijiensis DSM 17918 TaxID=1121256 RepID=A0A1M5B9C4_9THEO|nr:ABC-2 transporter permease [Caldanaerobius fijiensis]SHF38937.1 ABC-2 family transporter protein [Caldanaerobius fijiensis DSM 17918]
MLALVYKDLVQNKRMFTYFPLLVIFYMIIFHKITYSAGLLFMVAFVAIVFLIQSFYMDEKDNVYRFFKTLPISDELVIKSKFVSIFVQIVLAIAISVAILFLSVKLNVFSANLSLYKIWQTILIAMGAGLMYMGIFQVLYYKYGYMVSMRIMSFAPLIIGFGFSFLGTQLKDAGIISRFFRIGEYFKNFSFTTIVFTILTLGLITYVICMYVSINIFKKKDI